MEVDNKGGSKVKVQQLTISVVVECFAGKCDSVAGSESSVAAGTIASRARAIAWRAATLFWPAENPEEARCFRYIYFSIAVLELSPSQGKGNLIL